MKYKYYELFFIDEYTHTIFTGCLGKVVMLRYAFPVAVTWAVVTGPVETRLEAVPIIDPVLVGVYKTLSG